MLDSAIFPFCVVAAAVTITPGADTMLVIRNVLRGGRRDGLATTLGICSGVFIHAICSAAGLSVILSHSASAFHTVKLAGAIYLIWLGVRSIRDAIRGRGGVAPGDRDKPKTVRARKSMAEGFLSNLLNPKVAVFYLAFLPQFIGPGDPVFATSMLLAGIHYVMGILWLGLISTVLGRLRGWVTRSSVRRSLDGISGSILMLLGVRLALERR